ncbi:MAG: hypothetical protein PHY28_04365 [Dehalococcoidales bacterium]|nr:hypothetical protein [Dehalococcoidales bacterium]
MTCTFCGNETDEKPSVNPLVTICVPCADKVRDHWQTMIDKTYPDYRFETFRVNPGNVEAHTGAVKFANSDTTGLWISSKTPGNGKTHLAVSTVRQWLISHKPSVSWPFERLSKPYQITSDSRILQEVRKTYQDDSGEDEGEVISRYGGYSVLLIDDLGKYVAKDTGFAQRILYEIINIRYNLRKPTIFTTNIPGPELQDYLGEYICDRMRGMTRLEDGTHPIYEIKGESQR